MIMNKSIENLMNEHRRIERVLGALQTFADRVAQEPTSGRKTAAQFATFFGEFADKRHHGKEEDRLFQKMIQYGFPREFGPVAVMLHEHDEGRSHVKALAEIGAGSGPLSAAESEAIRSHALAFAPLLLGHIQKEDNVLYPMAQQALPAAELEALNESCAAFECEVMSPARMAQLDAMADALIVSYPADRAAMAAGLACFSCAGHAQAA